MTNVVQSQTEERTRPDCPILPNTGVTPADQVVGKGVGVDGSVLTLSTFKPPKEASHIELPPTPTPAGFRHWRIAVREAVAAAASDPQIAFAWVKDVENPKKTFLALGDSQGLVTLDAKLAAALTKIISGDFAKQVVALRRKPRKVDC